MDIQRHLKTKISRHGPDGEAGNLSSIPVWATKLVLTNADLATKVSPRRLVYTATTTRE